MRRSWTKRSSLASVEGLEGLSIGTLATALDMSKSGLYAHFGSKQELLLATVEEAGRVFEAEVIEPALAAPPGVAQLVAVCDAFFEHLERRRFPGGCFFAGATLEMGARPGPVNERIVAFQSSFTALIRQFVVSALELGQLPDDEDAGSADLRAERHDPRRQHELRPPPGPPRPRPRPTGRASPARRDEVTVELLGQAPAATRSAPRSPIITAGAWVWPRLSVGITEASSHPEPGHPPHAQLRVDDTVGVGAHAEVPTGW